MIVSEKHKMASMGSCFGFTQNNDRQIKIRPVRDKMYWVSSNQGSLSTSLPI